MALSYTTSLHGSGSGSSSNITGVNAGTVASGDRIYVIGLTTTDSGTTAGSDLDTPTVSSGPTMSSFSTVDDAAGTSTFRSEAVIWTATCTSGSGTLTLTVGRSGATFGAAFCTIRDTDPDATTPWEEGGAIWVNSAADPSRPP